MRLRLPRLRLPQVWPATAALGLVLVLHAIQVGFDFAVSPSNTRGEDEFARSSPVFLILAAIAFGVGRVRFFHPALNLPYRAWLEQTPWTPAKALPLGPVGLGVADAALLLVAVAAAWPFWGAAGSLVVVKTFLSAYVVTLTLALLATREWVASYAGWFGLGCMVLYRDATWPFLAACGATYAVELAGFRRSLTRFPWGFTWSNLSEKLERPGAAPRRRALGWPFGFLLPDDNYPSPGPVHGTAIAALVGWSLYVSQSVFTGLDPAGYFVFLFPVLFYALLIRHGVYGAFELSPPISLAGRLQTGRLIIPSYDRVYVAPMLALAILAVHVKYPGQEGLPWQVANPLAVGLATWVLLNVGPNRRTWMLTAQARIAPAGTWLQRRFGSAR